MNINITILGQAISFIIFVFLCMKYIWPPLITLIEKRQKEISDIFASAEHLKKTSEMIQIEARNYLKQAKIEAKLIIDCANQYKKQLINQTKQEAEFERKKILMQAYTEINIKKKCIAETLQKEVGMMVMLGVKKILKHPINKSIDYDVINTVLNELSNCNINNK